MVRTFLLLFLSLSAHAEDPQLFLYPIQGRPSGNPASATVKPSQNFDIGADLFEMVNGKLEGMRRPRSEFFWAIECGKASSNCQEPEWTELDGGRSLYVPNPVGGEIVVLVTYIGEGGPRQEARIILKEGGTTTEGEDEEGVSAHNRYSYYSPSSYSPSLSSKKDKKAKVGASGGGSGASGGDGESSVSRKKSRKSKKGGMSAYDFYSGSHGGAAPINTRARGYNRDNETPVLACENRVLPGGKMKVVCGNSPSPPSFVKELRVKKPKPKTVSKKLRSKKRR